VLHQFQHVAWFWLKLPPIPTRLLELVGEEELAGCSVTWTCRPFDWGLQETCFEIRWLQDWKDQWLEAIARLKSVLPKPSRTNLTIDQHHEIGSLWPATRVHYRTIRGRGWTWVISIARAIGALAGALARAICWGSSSQNWWQQIHSLTRFALQACLCEMTADDILLTWATCCLMLCTAVAISWLQQGNCLSLHVSLRSAQWPARQFSDAGRPLLQPKWKRHHTKRDRSDQTFQSTCRLLALSFETGTN